LGERLALERCIGNINNASLEKIESILPAPPPPLYDPCFYDGLLHVIREGHEARSWTSTTAFNEWKCHSLHFHACRVL